MKPFSSTSTTLGALVSLVAVVRGLKKKTLSRSGAVAACCVGFLLVGSGLRGFVLLMFYQIASSATKYKKSLKEAHDATVAQDSTRGAPQVLACSVLAVITSLVHVNNVGEEKAISYKDDWLAAALTCSIVAHHATCLADTLASELGILSKVPPVLIITPWKRVPPGTNGGVTLWGTFVSCIGGVFMGVGTALMDHLGGITPVQPLKLLLLGAICGFIGSLIDSILGATLQITYQDPDTKMIHHSYKKSFKQISGMNVLTNVQVNFVSVCFTMALGGMLFGPMIFD